MGDDPFGGAFAFADDDDEEDTTPAIATAPAKSAASSLPATVVTVVQQAAPNDDTDDHDDDLWGAGPAKNKKKKETVIATPTSYSTHDLLEANLGYWCHVLSSAASTAAHLPPVIHHIIAQYAQRRYLMAMVTPKDHPVSLRIMDIDELVARGKQPAQRAAVPKRRAANERDGVDSWKPITINGDLYPAKGWPLTTMMTLVQPSQPLPATSLAYDRLVPLLYMAGGRTATGRYGLTSLNTVACASLYHNAWLDKKSSTVITPPLPPPMAHSRWYAVHAWLPAPHPTGTGVHNHNHKRWHVVGGTNDADKRFELSVHECYDPITNTWTTLAPCRYTRHAAQMVASCDGQYLTLTGMICPFTSVWLPCISQQIWLNKIGGNDEGMYLNDCEIYCVATNTWHGLPSCSRRGDHGMIIMNHALPTTHTTSVTSNDGSVSCASERMSYDQWLYVMGGTDDNEWESVERLHLQPHIDRLKATGTTTIPTPSAPTPLVSTLPPSVAVPSSSSTANGDNNDDDGEDEGDEGDSEEVDGGSDDDDDDEKEHDAKVDHSRWHELKWTLPRPGSCRAILFGHDEQGGNDNSNGNGRYLLVIMGNQCWYTMAPSLATDDTDRSSIEAPMRWFDALPIAIDHRWMGSNVYQYQLATI